MHKFRVLTMIVLLLTAVPAFAQGGSRRRGWPWAGSRPSISNAGP